MSPAQTRQDSSAPAESGAMGRAVALHRAGRLDAAMALYRQVLGRHPDHPQALGNLGVALRQTGRFTAALACQRRVTALRPDDAGAWSNLGNVYRDLGRLDEARASLDRALALAPDKADIQWDRALLTLLSGDLKAGFAAYEWRWTRPDSARRPFAAAAWDGSDPTGRTVLVSHEQGLGDMIQFLRFVPLLKARGARVLLECPPPLMRLFAGADGIDLRVPSGHEPADADLEVPMMSLPWRLGLGPGDLPPAPYLRVPEPGPHQAHGAPHLPPVAPGGCRVGLVWAGKPSHRNDRNRSCPLATLAPLAAVPGVHLVSLQKGPAAADLPALGLDALVPDLAPGLEDMADTARLLAALDLVVTVDTSVAHLAGALGLPAWVMLPYAPDWRWQLGRDDSPWYPSLRLFRQDRPGDWAGVVDRVAAALSALSQAPAQAPAADARSRPPVDAAS
ncbi:MAG: glycosyltransferase family protein [Rhodobacterales bacterium]|nr:glycosyltransferase family protein [Rhodobacterales bacterium]